MEIIIASKFAPAYHGGLAGYQRMLARALSDSGKTGVFLSASSPSALPDSEEPLPWPALHARPTLLQRLSGNWWPSLASRPGWHPLLERLLSHAWQAPIKTPAKVVHFVGTGWDFFGFAMRDLARRSGARFTIWAAVHPGSWGDDEIDLRLYRAADILFCASKHEAGIFRGMGLDAKKIVVCGLPPMCGSQGDGRRLRASLGIEDRPVVFFLGRREKNKGYPALLEAWEIVRKTFPSAVLVVAGPQSENKTVNEPPPDSFCDLGIVTEEQKADAYAMCDIFCVPSAHESFGIVFAEAWSYGKPVICGPAPAPREWIRDGETGLHTGSSPAEIAASLLRLLEDPALRARMGQAGHRFQQEYLTPEATLATYLEAFGYR